MNVLVAARRPVPYRPLSRPVNHAPPAVYRLHEAARPAGPVEGQRDPGLARLEAVLWLADEPLSARRLATAAELPDTAAAHRSVARLRDLYAADRSAFQIEEVAGGYQLLTRPEFYPWLVRLRRTGGEGKLTAALMETLAIVAYRQPIMRADLEAVRGVHCGDALRQLMERKLVQIVGRHDSLGRPVLYGTTKKFLQTFGLRDLGELPPVEK
jgi:segregation and condensation protein B